MPDESAIAHQNLVDFGRFSATTNPDTEVLDEHDLLAVAGAVDFPAFRQAVPTTADAVADPADWAGRAEDFLLSRGKTGIVFARVGIDDALADVLLGRGFVEWSTSPEMVCTALAPPTERGLPDGFTVRLARSADDIAAYAAVAANAFTALGFVEEPTRAWLDRPDVLLAPQVVIAVGEREGRIAAGAMVVLFDGGRAYTAWVATLELVRGSGLGEAVTRRVTAEAFARGATMVSLEASPFGAPIYRRMGYRDLYDYRMLIKL